MSAMATSLWAWAAVHSFAALISLFLFVRMRSREYGASVVFSSSLAVHTAASALLADASTPFVAAHMQDAQYAAAIINVVAHLHFARYFIGRPTRRMLDASMIVAAVCIALVLSGLWSDPAHPVEATSGLSWGRSYHDVVFEPVGLGALVVAFALAAWAVKELLPRRALRDTRLLLTTSTILVLGWTHDIVCRAFHIRAVYLNEHAASVAGLLLSYLLLARFARTASELSQRTTELRHAYDELRLVQEELVQKEQLAAVGELSAVIAHEVRNPLAVLKNAVAGLKRNEVASDDRVTLLNVLDEETDRLNRLVRDLLAYARPVAPQWSVVDLRALLDRAIAEARDDRGTFTGVEIDVAFEGVGAELEGDRDLLEKVISNIVANAVQAMPGGGTLTVQTSQALLEGEPAVAVRFSDTGEGMDTLVRSRARDPFFTTRASGTGLGLAIVERIVRAHGGRIELQSTGQGGSTVTMLLPRRSDESDVE